ncbi:unnamed protein product [Peniophora sp. CBMAI 1063]|nr:unnamed protein product [Peniophora sp. CBMAI 1063]
MCVPFTFHTSVSVLILSPRNAINGRSGPPSDTPSNTADVLDVLGKPVWLTAQIAGCRGLPQTSGAWKNRPDSSRLCRITFQALSANGAPWVDSKTAQEGQGLARGTVRWNESLSFESLELSLISIALYVKDVNGVMQRVCETSVTVTTFLESRQLLLLPTGTISDSTECTLFFSASQMLDEPNQQERNSSTDEAISTEETRESPTPTSEPSTICAATPWSTVLRGLVVLVDITAHFKIRTRGYWILWELYDTYKKCMRLQLCRPEICSLTISLVTAIDTVLAQNQQMDLIAPHRRTMLQDVFDQLYHSANFIVDYVFHLEHDLMEGRHCFRNEPQYSAKGGVNVETVREGHGHELDRLARLAATTAPTSEANTRPTPLKRATTMLSVNVKDTLLLALEAIARTSDAIPPLKGATNGLLFFVTHADVMFGNRSKIQDIHTRIAGLAAQLEPDIMQRNSLARSHQDAIAVLAEDLSTVSTSFGEILRQRKSRFKRYLSAKRHHAELSDMIGRLDQARANFTTAVSTSNAKTNAEVLACVKAIMAVVGEPCMCNFGRSRSDSSSTSFETVPLQ